MFCKLNKLLHSAYARKQANEFISSEKYTKETIKTIKLIEKDIDYLSKRGFYEKRYDYFKINTMIDMNRVQKEFEKQGYNVYIKQWTTNNMIYDIKINWSI